MTPTRLDLVRQIGQMRGAVEALRQTGADPAIHRTQAQRGKLLATTRRCEGYLNDLEAVLGDYDRTHPYEDVEDAPDEADELTTTILRFRF